MEGVAARSDLIKQLQETRDIFLAGVSGISDAQGTFKPAPDRWSIEECAEHIALVENGLLMRLTQEATPSEHIERPERQEQLRKLGLDRASKRQAPERARPTGRFGSVSKALEQFVANREKTMAYLRDCQDDLHARTVVHPIGAMTCHELVVLMSAHTLRHLEQIREVQATPGYPRS
jgi:DinB superfamily